MLGREDMGHESQPDAFQYGFDGCIGFFDTVAKHVELSTGQAVQMLVVPSMYGDFVSLIRNDLDEVWPLERKRAHGEERGAGAVTGEALENPLRARFEVVPETEWHSPVALVVKADQNLSTWVARRLRF